MATWNLTAPPGFRGLHPDIPVTFYVRHLPHWRQDGATYFVSFRLADSLPQSKLQELESLNREFLAKFGNDSESAWETFARQQMQRFEHWLDQGIGACHLKSPDVAKILVDALQHFDDQTYELGCYVVMPNHVHLVIKPLEPKEDPLEKILQGRKLFSSRRINGLLTQSGQLWEEESFDRIIRDEEHLYRCVQYVGGNAKRAGLPVASCPRWIRPSWAELGWKFED